MTVLQSDGQKVELAADDIEDVQTKQDSRRCPKGWLNRLSLEQMADLFAYLDECAGAERGGAHQRRTPYAIP